MNPSVPWITTSPLLNRSGFVISKPLTKSLGLGIEELRTEVVVRVRHRPGEAVVSFEEKGRERRDCRGKSPGTMWSLKMRKGVQEDWRQEWREESDGAKMVTGPFQNERIGEEREGSALERVM
jgi:hypothetical protein